MSVLAVLYSSLDTQVKLLCVHILTHGTSAAVDDAAAHSCGGFVSAMQRTISMENCTEKSGDGLLSARHYYNTTSE